MYRTVLTFSLICSALFASAQSSAVATSGQDISINSAAINISIPSNALSEADGYFEEATKNERHGDLNDALTLFGKAAFEYNNEKKTSRYAESMLRMSNLHLQLTNYLEAEQVVLNVALKAYSKLGSISGQMASYNQLGKIYLAANKLTQSMWFYTQQGILAKQLHNNISYIDSVLGIAYVKIKKKDFKLAARDFNSAEYLSKSYKITQFNQQIKNGRALLAEKSKG